MSYSDINAELDLDTEVSEQKKKKQQKIIIGISACLILIVIITTVCFFCGRRDENEDATRYTGVTGENASVSIPSDETTDTEDKNDSSEENEEIASILADENINTSEEEIGSFTDRKKNPSDIGSPAGVTQRHYEVTTEKQVFHKVEPAN